MSIVKMTNGSTSKIKSGIASFGAGVIGKVYIKSVDVLDELCAAAGVETFKELGAINEDMKAILDGTVDNPYSEAPGDETDEEQEEREAKEAEFEEARGETVIASGFKGNTFHGIMSQCSISVETAIDNIGCIVVCTPDDFIIGCCNSSAGSLAEGDFKMKIRSMDNIPSALECTTESVAVKEINLDGHILSLDEVGNLLFDGRRVVLEGGQS